MKTNELRVYLAGFLDGEGTISIAKTVDLKRGKRYPRYRAILQIVNTVKSPLELFQRHYGGTVTPAKRRKAPHHLQLYVWRVSGRLELDKVLKDIVPFLIIKKEQAKLVIELRQRIEQTELNRSSSGKLQPLSEAENKRREALYKRVKTLNALSRKPKQLLFDLPTDSSQTKLL